MASQPDLASSGGVYRAESGTRLPYVYVQLAHNLSEGSDTEQQQVLMAAYIDNSIVILNIAEHLKAAKLPLSAFGCVDGGNLEIPVYRRRLVVDELDGFLGKKISSPSL